MSQNSLDLAPFIWLIFIYNQQSTSKPFFSNILPEINNNWQYLNKIWLCIDNSGIGVLYEYCIIKIKKILYNTRI
jgi:hypothetical protein